MKTFYRKFPKDLGDYITLEIEISTEASIVTTLKYCDKEINYSNKDRKISINIPKNCNEIEIKLIADFLLIDDLQKNGSIRNTLIITKIGNNRKSKHLPFINKDKSDLVDDKIKSEVIKIKLQ